MDDNKMTVTQPSGSLHIYVFILPVVCVMIGMAALSVGSVLIPNLFSEYPSIPTGDTCSVCDGAQAVTSVFISNLFSEYLYLLVIPGVCVVVH